MFQTILCTDIVKAAFITIWLCTCCTDITSMINQTMAELISLFRWNDLPQSHFYLLRLFDPIYQPHPVHQADTMGIRYDRRFSKDVTHDQIGTFASYPREL